MSRLAGAYLTVSEDTDCYEQMNDTFQQLSALDLNGIVKDANTDRNGDLHTEIIYYPPDPQRTDGKVVLISDEGEQTLIDAGYYVRLYKDKDQLGKTYENRDNTQMVAEGFIPAGDWDNPVANPNNPFVPNANSGPNLGVRLPLMLEERNKSGLSGTVNFDYYGGKNQIDPGADGIAGNADDINSPYDNADLTITPGGLRTTSSVHATMQEVDISGFTPGVHGDFLGNSYATIEYDAATPATTVTLYRDSSRTHMAAKGVINAQTGEIDLFETDKNGNFTQDLNGNPIRIGSIVVTDNALLDGQSDTFIITMGGVNNGGQKKEDNLFSTIHDALDALYANDMDTLHDLLDVIQGDIDRIVAAAGEVDARSKRIEMLGDRYSDDIIAFTEVYESTVGMDENAFIRYTQEVLMAEQQFNAAMMISTRYMQLSILDYI
jgi:hypothetical protein